MDGGNSIGTGTLVGGTPDVATFSTTGLSLGVGGLYSATSPQHSITAVYGSDTNFSGSTSDVVNQEVDPATLFVKSFTWTPTGFVATFNRAIDTGTDAYGNPVLNLYDVNLGTGGVGLMGTADVTVVDQAGNDVTGSFVVDQGGTRITFVTTDTTGTTGWLTNGSTYTVTLLSLGKNNNPDNKPHFRDTSGNGGNPLDGNADGTTGDNFTTSFTEAYGASPTFVSVPDFMRGPGQPVNVPNPGGGLPLTISQGVIGGQGVTDVTMQLTYNNADLTINGDGTIDSACAMSAYGMVTINTYR